MKRKIKRNKYIGSDAIEFFKEEEKVKHCYICTKEIDERKEYITLCKNPKTGERLHRHGKCKDLTPLKPLKRK